MDVNFWHQLWVDNEIRFHENQANPALVKHIDSLNLINGARIFLPLCGKTLDIAWLLERGYRVVGAELSELAINDLFDELHLVPKITTVGPLTRYQAHHLDIWVGDIFELSGNMLGTVDAIYDRGALVALPTQMRKRYAAQLIDMTDNAPQLLVVYEYDQQCYLGPPFAITEQELKQHYDHVYRRELLERTKVVKGFAEHMETFTSIWRFQSERA